MEAADDAEGDGPLQPERGAECNRPVTNLECFGIAQGRWGWKVVALELHQGQIGHRVDTDNIAVLLLAIGEGDADGLDAIDHMGIGEDQAMAIDHKAGPLTAFTLGAARWIPEQIAQQRINQAGVKGLPFQCSLGVDAHHGRGDTTHHIRHKAVLEGDRRAGQPGHTRHGHNKLEEVTQEGEPHLA